MDFISYHTYLLAGILGGTLATVIGFLSLLLRHCGYVRKTLKYVRYEQRSARVQITDPIKFYHFQIQQFPSRSHEEEKGPLFQARRSKKRPDNLHPHRGGFASPIRRQRPHLARRRARTFVRTQTQSRLQHLRGGSGESERGSEGRSASAALHR